MCVAILLLSADNGKLNDGEGMQRKIKRRTRAVEARCANALRSLGFFFFAASRRWRSAGRIKSRRKENEKEDTTMQSDRDRVREREREKKGGITKANSSEDRRKRVITTPDLSGKGKRDKADRKGRTT